jgi:hypothetical protein
MKQRTKDVLVHPHKLMSFTALKADDFSWNRFEEDRNFPIVYKDNLDEFIFSLEFSSLTCQLQ